jgi:hypothetical protein
VQTHPLTQWTLDEAIAAQWRLVDLIQREFDGREALEAGDWGAPPDLGRSRATARVERVLARFFDAEDATLVQGAGTGAIRSAVIACAQPGARVLVHDFPPYATTAVTFRAMGLRVERCDLHDVEAVVRALATGPGLVLLQHARQRLDDRHVLADVIGAARALAPGATVLVDDNYAALQVPRIGVQQGADLSAFSLFKLLGEPGVGCVVGAADRIARIRADNDSGGSRVHGPVAVATLKGLVHAPVALAIQALSVERLVAALNRGAVAGIARAHIGNHQERSALVELEEPVAARVVETAWRFGALPYPVGAQSRHEVGALVYRLSRAMAADAPALAARTVRVIPYRSGPETAERILRETMVALAEAGALERAGGARG